VLSLLNADLHSLCGHEILMKLFRTANTTTRQQQQQQHNNNNNNNIYFAKRQVNQKGKSPSKLATILRATKEKNNKNRKEKNYATNI